MALKLVSVFSPYFLQTMGGRSIQIAALFVCALASHATLADRNERWYQERFCTGELEHSLPDRTRVDCLTDTHAIEYDWATKWAQAIGQSLGYAAGTGRRAGIVLILKRPAHEKHWDKLNQVIDHHGLPIDTWAIRAWRVEAPFNLDDARAVSD